MPNIEFSLWFQETLDSVAQHILDERYPDDHYGFKLQSRPSCHYDRIFTFARPKPGSGYRDEEYEYVHVHLSEVLAELLKPE